MRLKNLRLNNVHGRNHDLTFDRVNVIVADNMASKTSILKAIRLLLTGSLPMPVGKLSSGIYKLAGNYDSPGEMSIHGEMDNGRMIDLSWTRRGDGSFTSAGHVPMDLALPELLSESKQFFSKTSADQIKLIFNACQVSATDFSAATLKAKLSGIQAMPAKVCEQTLDEVAKAIDLAFRGRTAQEAGEMMLQSFKVRQKAAGEAKDSASGAFEAFRGKFQAGRPVDCTTEIAAIERELMEAAGNAGADRQKAWSAVETAKNAITAIVPEIRSGFDEAVPEKLKAYAHAIADADNCLKTLQKTKPLDIGQLSDDLEADQGNMHDISVKRDKLLAEAEADKRLAEAVASLKLCKKCSKSIAIGISERLQECDAELGRLRAAEQKLQTAIQKASNSLASASQANDERSGSISTLEASKERLEANIERLQTAFTAYQTAVAALKALPPEPDTSAIRTRLNDAKGRQQAFLSYQSDVSRRHQLEQDLLKAQCQAEVYKAVVKVIQVEQETVMNRAFNAVLAVTRKFTDGILFSPLEFIEGQLCRRVSDVDRQHGNMANVGSVVPWETFSGTESLLAFCAFGVALSKNAPIKIVFLDELGVIRPDLKNDVVSRMLALTGDGTLDQVLMVDVSPIDYRQFQDCHGIKIIGL